MHVSSTWNATYLICVGKKKNHCLRVFQKYSFIGNTFGNIYREPGYRETLLKFWKNSLVLGISTKTSQQEQQNHQSVRVSWATCDSQCHQ